MLLGTSKGLILPPIPKSLTRLLNKIKNECLFYFYASLIDCIDEIYIEDLYESKTLIRSGDIIVDAGANVGMFTLKAARLVGPSGAVIAFEPVKENLKLIKDNIYINNLKNVSIIPKALGDNTGYAKIYLSKSSARHSLAADVISKSDVLGIDYVEGMCLAPTCIMGI